MAELFGIGESVKAPVEGSTEDFESMSVAGLRAKCRERGIGSASWTVMAKKSDLLEALKTGHAPEAKGPEAGELQGLVSQLVAFLAQAKGSPSVDIDQVRRIAREEAAKVAPRTVEVKIGESAPVDVGLAHNLLPDIIRVLGAGLHIWIVGPAGSGKTTAAEQAAKALGLDFYCQSVSQQTPVSQLLGYMDATGKYVSTAFFNAYSKGGVFVLDEADAGNANVLATLNSALANGVCSFPCGMIPRHENAHIVACANTFGIGADRKYVGRAPIDAATLDRFVFLEFPYDEKLEKACAQNDDWTSYVQKVRAVAASLKIDTVISPRASIQGARLLRAGFKRQDIEPMILWRGMSKDTISKIKAGL